MIGLSYHHSQFFILNTFTIATGNSNYDSNTT